MTIASDQSQVCLDAVSACEILLRETGNKKRLSQPIIKLLDECAHICMGTFLCTAKLFCKRISTMSTMHGHLRGVC